MMGNHHHYGKTVFYEDSAKVPMLLVPPAGDPRVVVDREDGRLAALADVMPTLLDICGVPAPDGVEGLSLVGEERRSFLYGELYDDAFATRMAHDGRHKLVYYPTGNRAAIRSRQRPRRDRRGRRLPRRCTAATSVGCAMAASWESRSPTTCPRPRAPRPVLPRQDRLLRGLRKGADAVGPARHCLGQCEDVGVIGAAHTFFNELPCSTVPSFTIRIFPALTATAAHVLNPELDSSSRSSLPPATKRPLPLLTQSKNLFAAGCGLEPNTSPATFASTIAHILPYSLHRDLAVSSMKKLR